nr:hypothetical protein Itr_chr14CG09050 [Ipomoea trifida]
MSEAQQAKARNAYSMTKRNESSLKDNLTHKQHLICHKTKRCCNNEEEKENAALGTQIQGHIVHIIWYYVIQRRTHHDRNMFNQ